MDLPQIENNKIYYEYDPRTPVTKISIVFVGAGEQKEEKETIGLSTITAKLLFRGTSLYSIDELQKKLDLLGVTISAFANETDFVIKLSSLSRNIDETVSLLHHVITEANFSDEQIQLVKRQERNRLQSLLQNNDEVLRMANKYFLFDKSSKGKVGSTKALEYISKTNIVEYFKKVISSRVIYITAISDLNESIIRKTLDVITSGRETTGYLLDPELEYRKANGRDVFIIDSPGAPNDRLMWSHEGIKATDSRRFTLSLILDALGSFEGFLFDHLRNKNGWCYGIYAYQNPPSNRKGLIGYYSDPSDLTSRMLVPKLMELLKSFSGYEDFLTRLGERNATFKNRFAYQQDLNYKIMSQINRDRYAVPILTKEEYFAEIDSIKQSVALKAIVEIFDCNNLTMVFYGDAIRISTILSTIDPSMPIEIRDKSELIA